jgi:hypothetical protein
MDLLFSHPATLIGIIGCVALGAWTLGRWQIRGVNDAAQRNGQSVPQHPLFEWNLPAPPDAAPATPCQQSARAEREAALDMALSLGELHAEISAYRQREQVLARIDDEGLWADMPAPSDNHVCRYLGVTGEPICPTPTAALAACSCSSGSAVMFPREWTQRAAQPSPLTFV